MILELCGGEPGPVTAAGAEPAWQRDATMRFSRIFGDFGGSDISADEAVASLERLGFAVRGARCRQSNGRGAVVAQRHRGAVALDLAPSLSPAVAAKVAEGCAAIEPECDLIEEVLRLQRPRRGAAGLVAADGAGAARDMTPKQQRTALAAARWRRQGIGGVRDVQLHGGGGGGAVRRGAGRLRLTNPIAADLDQLRPTPVATLALAAQRNAARGYPDTALFEVGPAFRTDADGQCLMAAGVRAGSTGRSQLGAPARAVDAMDAKADLWAVHGRRWRAAGGADRSRRTRPASTIPAAPAPCGRDRRPCSARSANCIRGCSPRSG
jgi:phenylalanyl-tRNA synthetase beta chain